MANTLSRGSAEALYHVFYEMKAMADAALQLLEVLRHWTRPFTPEQRFQANLLLENVILHTRCLDEFFGLQTP